MKKIPIFSIVTPSYNQGRFIKKTIKSILEQSGLFYIDYIIQDGGSTDNSVATIRKAFTKIRKNSETKLYKNLTFYKNKNIKNKGISFRWESNHDGGQVNGIKKGLKKAKGDYFSWLNSDDTYYSSKTLDHVKDAFQTNPDIECIIGDGTLIDEKGKKTGKWEVEKVNNSENIYLDYHILQPSTFIQKDIVNSKYLDNKYTCAFDIYFFYHT
jgi:glycosyltransferase involved in cell wall biosynthesis